MLNGLMFTCSSFVQLDPRSKLFVFFACSFAALREPRILFQALLFALAFVLLLNGRQYSDAFKMLLLYLGMMAADLLLSGHLTGGIQVLFLTVFRVFRMFIPVIMVFMLMIKTTRVSEFTAAFDKMHLPDEITIPFSVMFRFFPTIGEEWENIQNAMKFRGLSLNLKNLLTRPALVYECTMVPLLADTVMIADELSAAALSRGLGGDKKRTCMAEVRLRFPDYLVMAAALALNIISFNAY